VHQGGLWEFPGGKLEPGETPEQGLGRELTEELGIRVVGSRPLIRILHDYGDRQVLLDVRRVTSFQGVPHGREGQPLAWCLPEEMKPEGFPAADRPIIIALRLPPLYLITGEDPRDPERFLMRLAKSIERGVRLVQLRAHRLSNREYGRLASQAFELCERRAVRLILNRNPERLGQVPRHGLHLTGAGLSRLSDRKRLGDGLIGASCHSVGDLQRAARLGLDYALLSPVLPTASHPGREPLGWDRFARLADAAALPVYALGGLGPADLDEAVARGGQGVAAIRGLWLAQEVRPGPQAQ
jgi:8-oxo-dGTP diphosphatase